MRKPIFFSPQRSSLCGKWCLVHKAELKTFWKAVRVDPGTSDPARRSSWPSALCATLGWKSAFTENAQNTIVCPTCSTHLQTQSAPYCFATVAPTTIPYSADRPHAARRRSLSSLPFFSHSACCRLSAAPVPRWHRFVCESNVVFLPARATSSACSCLRRSRLRLAIDRQAQSKSAITSKYSSASTIRIGPSMLPSLSMRRANPCLNPALTQYG